MRLMFDNVNFGSRSGPNSFANRLAVELSYRGHILVGRQESPDVNLAFIQETERSYMPVVQRLDGIWFNIDQDYERQNIPIRQTYNIAKAVICQSEFDKTLVQKFFGQHDNCHVIHNGIDVESIKDVDPLTAPSLSGVKRVWTCASSWRPHKRLRDNIRYFMEHAGVEDCLVIAGQNPDVRIADPRIFYAGDLDHEMLYSLLKATDVFLHLAFLDHCPNTVIEARAAGCQVICSSSGGTEEIAGFNSIVIEEDEWDLEPCHLYNPPQLNFSRKRSGKFDSNIDIKDVTQRYENVLIGALT